MVVLNYNSTGLYYGNFLSLIVTSLVSSTCPWAIIPVCSFNFESFNFITTLLCNNTVYLPKLWVKVVSEKVKFTTTKIVNFETLKVKHFIVYIVLRTVTLIVIP